MILIYILQVLAGWERTGHDMPYTQRICAFLNYPQISWNLIIVNYLHYICKQFFKSYFFIIELSMYKYYLIDIGYFHKKDFSSL